MRVVLSICCSLMLCAGVAHAQQDARAAAPRPSPAESTFAARVAGCYEFATEALRADSGIAKFATVPAGPIRFAMTTRPAFKAGRVADEHDFYFAVDTDTLPQHGRGMFLSWILLSSTPESAFVAIPLPMGGVSLRLTPRGSDLVGTFTAMTDAVPPDGVAEASLPIVARRTSCNGIHR